MKKIYKNSEPSSLTQYRSSISTDELNNSNIYEDFPYKTKQGCSDEEPNNLRKQLLEEQGYICCYCMSRIDCQNSKIEHFKPQTRYRESQIDYKNLFIACKGGEGSQKDKQYCDTKKSEQELNHIDLLSNIENSISYEKKAKEIFIKSDNIDINDELNTVLNLNISLLIKNRKEAYDNVIKQLISKKFSSNFIKKTLIYYQTKHNGKYEPYCEMIVYFLAKKLRQSGVTV